MDQQDDQREILWHPDRKQTTRMDSFRKLINEKYSISLSSYQDLYKWSVDEYETFWSEFWSFSGLIAKNYDLVIEKDKRFDEVPKWFIGSQLNYTENILERGSDSDVAVIACNETHVLQSITFKELKLSVKRYASALRAIGVKPGDRVVGLLPNTMETLFAYLSCIAIGAIWSCTSPEFGSTAIVQRFRQISPVVLFAISAVSFSGKTFDQMEKLEEVTHHLPDLSKIVIINAGDAVSGQKVDSFCAKHLNVAVELQSFLASAAADDCDSFQYTQVPFHHPMCILYSSGTTGTPKCMVHSQGGTLIQHLKEHQLHGNIQSSDVLLYYTTTGWMMYNWEVSVLATGACLVLYDGSAVISRLWSLIDSLNVTVFGTSAKWIDTNEQNGFQPNQFHKLKGLHTILSTGSPLSPQSFRWVYNNVKKNILLGSISGGSDIISCFVGHNPILPVVCGQIQCRLLAMAIECTDESGRPVLDAEGEMVCTKPFPCMPVFFWGDTDGTQYKKAYFDRFENIWSHGDYCRIDSVTGGVIMLGRSDGTLNPNGIRFGSSEIYNIVQSFSVEITDSVCVSQCNDSKTEERVILFLKMKDGEALSDGLISRLKTAIREELSPRHVPALILPIGDIPYTMNGKKVELAVKSVIEGRKVATTSCMVNPESLELFKNVPQLR